MKKITLLVIVITALFGCTKNDLLKENKIAASQVADTTRPIKYFRLYIPAIKTSTPYRIPSTRNSK